MGEEPKSFLERLAGLSALYGAVSLVFYVILRIAYVQFYARAGLEPEDVGLGRTELLAQALTGPAFFAVIYAAIYLLIMAIFIWPASRFTGTRQGRPRFLPTAIGASLLSLAITIFLLYDGSHELADDMQNGDAARTSYLNFRFLRIPLMQIWALPVDLKWLGDGAMPSILKDTECMFYLGQANKIGVLYDVTNQRSIRFQTDSVIISTSLEPELLPDKCLNDE